MTDNTGGIMNQKRCQHLVLDECSQEHHNNCLGFQQCILDLEKELWFTKNEVHSKTDYRRFST